MGGAQETGSSWMEEEGSSLDEKVEFHFYVLLPNIIYVMQSRRFSQYPAILSWTEKERDKKYSVKSPERYKM
jgi:hypothetical protein